MVLVHALLQIVNGNKLCINKIIVKTIKKLYQGVVKLIMEDGMLENLLQSVMGGHVLMAKTKDQANIMQM